MKTIKLLGALAASLVSSAVLAIPALQLGPGADLTDWSYYGETWVFEGGGSFSLSAYANATKDDDGNGKYAWESESSEAERTAFLIATLLPDQGNIGGLPLSVSNATLVGSGWGTPPPDDENSLPSHGVYPSYFEVYQFVFDGPIGEIKDQQPGKDGTGMGYTESFDITVGALPLLASGIHFDLYTTAGDGDFWNDEVYKFAPFSHDAAYKVPEPGMLSLLGAGLLGIGIAGRRRRKSAAA